MTDALIILVMILSAILTGLLAESLVKGRRVDKGLDVLRATNDARIAALVERTNRDMRERAARYRRAHDGK